jgi:hypothetical protein
MFIAQYGITMESEHTLYLIMLTQPELAGGSLQRWVPTLGRQSSPAGQVLVAVAELHRRVQQPMSSAAANG